MSYDDLKQRLRDGEYVDGYEATSVIENLEHRLASAQAAGVELWREIAEFAERSGLEYADTEEWTRRDSGSCLTIRVPVALLNRIREATTPSEGVAAPVEHEAKTTSKLTLAVIGRRHFGNPIPQEWYAAAHDLLADVAQAALAAQAAVNQQMAAALRFMLAYENDDAVAIAEIQAAFNQQEAVKDAQEFARCYCARKMRDALDLAAPAAVPQGVEAQAPAQPSAAPVLEADLLALREDVAKLYQSAMAITSQAAQEFAQRVVEHVRRTHGVAPAQPSAEQVRDAALEEAATICDSADKSTHPADLADRIRAKRTTASSEQSAGGFGGGARNSDGSFVISTGGGGARNSDGSFVISAAGGGVPGARGAGGEKGADRG